MTHYIYEPNYYTQPTMPFYKKKTYRKKAPMRRRTYAKPKYSLTKSSRMPLGKTFRFTTRYVETKFAINAGLAATTYVFSLNGLFDPNITTTGHQPLGFDQIMPMYDHYTVIGAKARVNITNTDPDNAQIVALHLKDTSVAVSNINQILENGQAKWTTVGPLNSGSSNKTLAIGCNTSKFFGRSVLDGDKYYGTVSSNPADQVYLHITIADAHTDDPLPVDVQVELSYVAILSEPKTLAQS